MDQGITRRGFMKGLAGLVVGGAIGCSKAEETPEEVGANPEIKGLENNVMQLSYPSKARAFYVVEFDPETGKAKKGPVGYGPDNLAIKSIDNNMIHVMDNSGEKCQERLFRADFELDPETREPLYQTGQRYALMPSWNSMLTALLGIGAIAGTVGVLYFLAEKFNLRERIGIDQESEGAGNNNNNNEGPEENQND